MKVWSNTNTLDGYLDDIEFTDDKLVAEVALIGGKPIDLSEFPKLKGLFKTGVGTDNIPFDEGKKRGVEIRLPSESTSNWIFEETANFACYLCLRMFYDQVGILESWAKLPRKSLRNQTLLIIGTGNIGRRVRDKMSLFCHVTTFDSEHDPWMSLPELMTEADCITLHIPLTPTTRSFINAEKLGWMKLGAALVNTARGAVVDENALQDALTAGRIRAAFDVFWKEPYQGPLRVMPQDKFIMTPHIASTCDEFLQGCARDLRNFCNEIQ